MSNKTDIVLPCQKTTYTCGPACLSAVLAFQDIHCDEQDIARQINACPTNGVDNAIMSAWASRYLAVTSTGVHSYEKGLAIANIRNPFNGSGHYVLLLGMRGNYARFFCPRLGKTLVMHRDNIDWRNNDGTLEGWSLNFAYDQNLFDLSVATQKVTNYLFSLLQTPVLQVKPLVFA
jgi:hypothetical protein